MKNYEYRKLQNYEIKTKKKIEINKNITNKKFT